MEYFNKIKNTVSTALPGNPITREYEVRQHIGTAGPDFLWKIYSAQKKSTKQEAAVWLMEKKQLDGYPKAMREQIVEFLKRGTQNLTRIRHPKVVAVYSPVEDSRESLAFATEPLFTSLANALSQRKNLSQEMVQKLENFQLHEIEVKHGLMQINEALIFLHNDAKQMHVNLAPHSVVINKLGCWKLAGMEFLTAVNETNPHESKFDLHVYPDCSLGKPCMAYCAPELLGESLIGPSADLFSFGMLVYSVYNHGALLNQCGDSVFEYKKTMEKLKDKRQLAMVPDNLQEFCLMCINHNGRIRPDAHQMRKCHFYDDPNVTALQSLDDLYQLDNLAKSQFYKSLPQMIKCMPKRICIFRVLPQLCEEFSNPNMVPFVLPTVLMISELSDQVEFDEHVMPKLIPVLALKEPVQVLLIFLQNLTILMKKMRKTDFSNYCLPLICSSLSTDDRNITQLCLNLLPSLGEHLEFKLIKSHVLPRLKKLFVATDAVQIKIGVFIVLGKLLQFADKWFVIDDVIPFLGDIRSTDATVLMAVYAIYRISLKHRALGLSREVIATKVLPHVLTLSISLSLNLKQYQAYADLIRELCQQLEAEQREKLRHAGKVNEQADAINFNSSFSGEICDSGQAMEDMMRVYSGWQSANGQINGTSAALPAAGAQLALEGPTSSALVPSNMSLTTYNDMVMQAQQQQHESPAKRPGFVEPPKELTLEEKRRMMNNQQQTRTLNATSSSSATSRMSSNQPRDLTNQLINQNLANLSLSATEPPKALPWQQQPNYNINMNSFSTLPQQQQFPRPSMMMSGGGGFPSYGAPVTGSGPMRLPNSSNQPRMNALSKSEIDDLLG